MEYCLVTCIFSFKKQCGSITCISLSATVYTRYKFIKMTHILSGEIKLKQIIITALGISAAAERVARTMMWVLQRFACMKKVYSLRTDWTRDKCPHLHMLHNTGRKREKMTINSMDVKELEHCTYDLILVFISIVWLMLIDYVRHFLFRKDINLTVVGRSLSLLSSLSYQLKRCCCRWLFLFHSFPLFHLE